MKWARTRCWPYYLFLHALAGRRKSNHPFWALGFLPFTISREEDTRYDLSITEHLRGPIFDNVGRIAMHYQKNDAGSDPLAIFDSTSRNRIFSRYGKA